MSEGRESTHEARYQVLGRVGEGAFGEVLLARDRRLGREVALKVLKVAAGDAAHLARFEREARLLARHPFPGIVGVLDLDLEASPPWVALEWMPGGDLAKLVEAGTALPASEVAATGARLARALAHLHAHGVLHRDIKLANVLLDGEGEPALADLGLARPVDDEQLTRTGCVVGTPRYLPEEVLTRGEYSEASDVYSLGLALLELATGTRLEGLASLGNRVQDHVQRVVDARLRTELRACLRRDPGARVSATSLAERLDDLAGGGSVEASCASEQAVPAGASPVVAPPPDPAPAAARPGARALGIGAAVLLGLLLPGGPGSSPPPGPPKALVPAVVVDPRPVRVDAEAVTAAGAGLEDCGLEAPPERWRGDTLGTFREEVRRLLAPGCRDAFRGLVTAAAGWLRARGPMASARPDPGELALFRGAVGLDRGYLHSLASLRRKGQEALISNVATLGPVGDLLAEVEACREDLRQEVASIEAALEAGPGVSPELASLVRLRLVAPTLNREEDLLPPVDALGRWLPANAGSPWAIPVAHALVLGLEAFAGAGPVDGLGFPCEGGFASLRAAEEVLRGDLPDALGVDARGAIPGTAFRALRSCPASAAAHGPWVRDRLVERVAVGVATGDARVLEGLRWRLLRDGRWPLPPEALPAMSARLDAAAAALERGWERAEPFVPGDADPGAPPGAPAAVAAMERGVEAWRGCVAPAPGEAGMTTPAELSAGLERLLAPGCAGHLPSFRDALLAWLRRARAGSVEPSEESRVLDDLARDGMVAYLDRVNRFHHAFEQGIPLVRDHRELLDLAAVGQRATDFQEAEGAAWIEALPLTDPRGLTGNEAALAWWLVRSEVARGVPLRPLYRVLLREMLFARSRRGRERIALVLAEVVTSDLDRRQVLDCGESLLGLEAVEAIGRDPRSGSWRDLPLAGVVGQAAIFHARRCGASARSLGLISRVAARHRASSAEALEAFLRPVEEPFDFLGGQAEAPPELRELSARLRAVEP